MKRDAHAARNAAIVAARALPVAQRPTLKALALEHGVSRERIRQIEARARARAVAAATKHPSD